MAKQRSDIMSDDPIVVLYLVVVITALTMIGMAMA